jgi:hypothetical protein
VSEKVDILLGVELGDTCAYEILCFWMVFDVRVHCAYMIIGLFG